MLRALNDNIIVREVQEEKTDTGLIIMSAKQSKNYTTGQVVGIGSGRKLSNGIVEPIAVNIGDMVIYEPHVYQTIAYEFMDYHVLSEKNIVAILE